MTYSNYDLILTMGHFVTGHEGVDGSGLPILHTALSGSPPSQTSPDVEEHCRRFRVTGGGQSHAAYHFLAKDTLDGGAFLDTPNTTAIEMIFSARLETGDIAKFQHGGCGVLCRNINYGFFDNAGASESSYGYGLRLSTCANMSISEIAPHVGLYARESSTNHDEVIVSSLPVLGTVLIDTWYTLKLEVVPSGNIQDLLTAYVLTGTDIDDDNDWTQVSQLTINNIDPGYISWNSPSQRMGFYAQRASKSNFSSQDDQKYYPHMDYVRIRLKTMP